MVIPFHDATARSSRATGMNILRLILYYAHGNYAIDTLHTEHTHTRAYTVHCTRIIIKHHSDEGKKHVHLQNVEYVLRGRRIRRKEFSRITIAG